MFAIETSISAEQPGRTGVFAENAVLKDDIVWRRNERSIHVYSAEEYRRVLKAAGAKAEKIKSHTFPQEVTICGHIMRALCRDTGPGGYINHSDTPNLGLSPDRETLVALRHIRAGDALTRNYREFVPDLNAWRDVEHCASFLVQDRIPVAA